MRLTLSILLFLVFFSFNIFATDIRLRADRNNLSVGDELTLTLSITEDSSDEIREITEPDFKNFDVANRGESSSSSFNMINGAVSYKKEKTITYVLRPLKEGSFNIGPAVIEMKSGKKTKSNTLNFLIVGGGSQPQNNAGQNNSGDNSGTEQDDKTNTSGADSLFAPLSAWEKKTDKYFIRVIVNPQENVYRGEPVTVVYYLFIKKNSITDLNFYKLPSFENVWSEELETPKKLNFQMANIDGSVYDYALLRKYLLIPDDKSPRITGTQMILDVMTGSFFNTYKKSLSSIAINTEVKDLPDAAQHKDAKYGSFTIEQDKKAITLAGGKLLDTVSYTISGCGNFQGTALNMPEVSGIKIFSPDIKQYAAVKNDKYCGSKTFKFMVKGVRRGDFEIPALSLEFFDREKGYYTLHTQPVKIKADDVSAQGENTEEKRSVRYEFLKEMPAGLAVYELTPLLDRPIFITALSIPLAALIISFAIWFFMNALRGRSKKASYISKGWEAKLKKAKDLTELLNFFYDALAEVHGIQLRGTRAKDIDETFGHNITPATGLIRELEEAIYSAGANAQLEALRKKTVDVFRNIRGLK